MAKILGIGACGNKALAELITTGIIKKEDALMMNSTEKDIPENFEDVFVKVGTGLGGCGKERTKGKNIVLNAIKKDQLDHLDKFIEDEDQIYIITSSEGGTGSGATPVISSYYKEVHGADVHIFVFTGFEDDARGLANTVEFFQELRDDIILHAISNKKFLDDTNGNKLKAEKLANKYLTQIISVLLGLVIKESEQNIDETDLYKVVNTPGYSIVETALIDRSIKNRDAFNKLVSDAIDDTKIVDIEEPACKRLAVILDIAESTEDAIDFSFDVIKEKLGVPYDSFFHVQNTGEQEFISIIVSGLELPITEIQDIHKRYLETIGKIGNKKDEFFSQVQNMDTTDDFDMTSKPKANKKDKSSFLSSFGQAAEVKDDLAAKKGSFTESY